MTEIKSASDVLVTSSKQAVTACIALPTDGCCISAEEWQNRRL